MKLDSAEAQRLVNLVERAGDLEAAVAAAGNAFSFLVSQLHLLGESANGYPQNPIDGTVWKEGHSLARVCDHFADAVARWQQRRGEEQATRLAVAMAMQVVAHYPEEIFPRVLRNAKCCESLGMTSEAGDGYRCIVEDFEKLGLEENLDTAAPHADSQATILTCLTEALAALLRLSPEGLTDAQLALRERANALLAARSSSAG
jgi:hypothetical protein